MNTFFKASGFLFLLVVALFGFEVEGTGAGPQVKLVHGGMIEGEPIEIEVNGKRVTIDQYLGIPYAESPKRFASSKPHPGWSVLKKATEPSKICIQPPQRPGFETNNKVANVFVIQKEMSEDCLYLNVWSPKIQDATANTKKPVMVWISGGAFTAQSSNLFVYNGSFLAASEGVIVVSMNYRVNAFGFFRLEKPNTVNGDDALGNQGLDDIKVALQWVQDNIEKFGGNKNMVTVFGESSGAASASILWLSKKTQNLFKRAILQSGSIYARWSSISMSEAEERAETLANACGCETKQRSRNQILECLRLVPASYLLGNLSAVMRKLCEERNTKLSNLNEEYRKMQNYEMSGCLYFNAPFVPVRDGDLIAENINSMFQNMPGTPELLIGVNKNEGMYFLLYGINMKDTNFLNMDGTITLPESMKGTKDLPTGKFVSLILSEFVGDNLIKRDAYEYPAYFYQLHTNSTAGEPPLMTRLDNLAGDLDFKCPTLEFANQVAAKQKSKVYVYSFEKQTRNHELPDWLGVLHAAEIEYVFGMPKSEKFQREHYTFTAEEQEVSDKVMKFWANFARTGNPNGVGAEQPGVTNWPPYEPSQREYLIISSQGTTGKQFRRDACNFWSDLAKRYP